MKSLIKKFIPRSAISWYHLFLAKLAAWWFGYPSRRLVVVGVTGTGGKSSTVYLLAKLLEAAGKKVGVTSTVFFKVGEWEKLNDKKMTMLGRFQTQKMLSRMVKAGCEIALIETTSQGIEQFRHIDIDYDVVVLTNLYPEHLEAHGGFANYQKAKGKLFAALATTYKKSFAPPKTIIVNGDDEQAEYFLSFPADKKVVFGLKPNSFVVDEQIKAFNYLSAGQNISFKIEDQDFSLSLMGELNIYNSLCAVTITKVLGLGWQKIKLAAGAMKNIPGRQEFIEAGQNFKVMVDYAFEPKAMTALYETIKQIPHQRIIHVLGGTGGGRDVARRPILGEIAGQQASVVIVTNEDPYDDDPLMIINQVADGAIRKGKQEGQDLWKILDRREAIAKAIALSQPEDLILVTGKGSEQAICVKNGQKIPWDDRQVAKEEILKALK
ncbi:MAG TPA: UDP-N-acetylmuramyl-tripeptide synthetase [Candidatus Magasanikbacteria bacterium]|nr:UDP-N-acetylmuramyl-tripeptide synthetase [Candidatus Magasanikbacteria bacterium]